MLATCFALLTLSLHAGDVVTIPASTMLVVPGKLNWMLREPAYVVPPETRAIITRLAPDRLASVVEVKVFDGTDRLGWLEDVGLIAIRPPANDPGEVLFRATFDRSRERKPHEAARAVRPNARRGHLPDFAAVDAMLATGIQQAQASGNSAFAESGSRASSRSGSSHICNKPNRSKPGFCQRKVADGGACPEHGT